MSADNETEFLRLRPWILRIGLWVLALVAIAGILGMGWWIEMPLRLFFGWIFHLFAMAPPLLPRWRELLFPLACLAAALAFAHHFLRWFFAARMRPLIWKAGHTAAALLLLLLGSAAAIAVSGIVHQLAWLAQDEVIINRGRDPARTLVTNRARQIVLAMWEFADTHGRYPHDLSELEGGKPLPDGFSRVRPGSRSAEEPFILLRPGGIPVPDEEVPVLLSPMLESKRRYVVGYSSGACTTMPERKVEELLNGLSPRNPGSDDEE